MTLPRANAFTGLLENKLDRSATYDDDMDNEAQARTIDDQLDALMSMPVTDDQSARDAFTHLTMTVRPPASTI
jgi:hypothetical protein